MMKGSSLKLLILQIQTLTDTQQIILSLNPVGNLYILTITRIMIVLDIFSERSITKQTQKSATI